MKKVILIITILFSITSCGIYSFSGTSIDPDVKTVNIPFFEYTALTVNPSLSQTITNALQDKFRKLTRLQLVDQDGDLTIEGTVTNYNISATAVTAQEVAAQNRLTVTVKVKYTNKKDPEENFDKNFSAFSDYDSTQSFESVESSLVDEIVEKLCDDIFNSTVSNW